MGTRNSAFVSYLLVDMSMESAFRSVQLYVTWLFIQVYKMPGYLSIMLSVITFFNLLFIPISGAWSNKVRLPCYVARAVHLGGLMSLVLIISINMLGETKYWMVVLTILTALLGISTALLRPLSMKVINSLFQEEEMISKAYKVKYSLVIFNILLGPTLSGFILSAYGGKAPLVLSCFFYGLAWLGAIIFKRTNRNPSRNILEPNSAVGVWVTEIIRGFKLGFYIEEERTIAVMSILLNFFFAPFIFLLLPAVMLQVHEYSMREVGLIELCLGIGIVISCTDYFSAFLRRKRNLYHICLLCMLVFTSAFFVFSMLSTMLPLCLAGVIMGAALNSFNVIVNTRRAYCIPSAQQTMMESCFLFLCTAAIPIGFVVTGGLMNLYSLQIIMRSYAFICLFPALILYTSCSVKRMFQETVQADYYAKQYPQLFNRL